MILSYFHQPGIQEWWRLRRMAYSEPFKAFLESSSHPEAIVATTEQWSRTMTPPRQDDQE